MTMTELLVSKSDLATTRVRQLADAPLQPGQVRVRIDRFALTANNITYAAFGDAMHYWDFFPVQGDAAAGWGRVPVWGFGTVVESACADVPVGERLYGYWPMASHAVLTPARITASGWFDGVAHRAALPAIYNQYHRTGADLFYRADTEDLQALLRPLFTTSWLIDDFLADNACFGADTLLLSSASSKTAYGTAFQLAQREGLRVVGLTSAGNRAFCDSLGCYDQVLSYDALDTLPADTACVYVDFAGSAALRQQIHTRFPHLRYSCAIGATHVSDLGGGKGLPGPAPTMFFAPAQIKKRRADWGGAVLGQRLLADWQRFTTRVSDPAQPWLRVRAHAGEDALVTAYGEMLAGRSDPREGQVFRLS